MKKISSSFTVFNKKIFPAFWFGVLAILIVVSLASGTAGENPAILIPPVLMALLGYAVLKKLVWDLVDEVYDGGDFLLVRNRGEEERIALSNIMRLDRARRNRAV